MISMVRANTPIRVYKYGVKTKDADGFRSNEPADLFNEVVLCEWINAHGSEVYQASAVNAQNPGKLRMWYRPGIDASCLIVRQDDNAEFEIISIDDVSNAHRILEIAVKRYVRG